jgi:lysozyme
MSGPSRITSEGIDLIKRFEGLRLAPYNCPAGHATIGYGHLIHKGETTAKDRALYHDFTQDDADALLRGDVAWAEDFIIRSIKVPLTQHQFDALCSFVFNIGATAAGGSSIWTALRGGQYQLAADNLLRWNKAREGGGTLVVSEGLSRRRDAERHLFMGRDSDAS